VVADDHCRIGVLERRAAGKQMVCGGGQGVLVGASVDVVVTHELLGRSVVDAADGRVGGGESADVVEGSRNPEVCQQNPLATFPGLVQQNVGGFDASVMT
jgi:hypothetical protein